MVDNSDLELSVCLRWITERPFVGKSRRSSSFRLFGYEWYLELQFERKCTAGYAAYYRIIWLCRTTVNDTIETCCVDTDISLRGESDKILGEKFTNCNFTAQTTKQQILDHYVSDKGLEQASNSVTYWKIICLLRSEQPLSLQTSTQTIYLSTADDKNLPQNSVVVTVDKCVQVSREIPPDMEKLSNDFSKLLEKKILPDVKLKCGNQTISVHRSILAGRSEVFAAMFQNIMLESETGTVDVPDMEAPVLNLLLKYAYSGKIEDISEDSDASLYEAGDKYAMYTLKVACADWMIRNVTEENCISYLNIADAHSDRDFKAAVISFIINHPAVLKSTDWFTFSEEHPKLANEVLQGFVASVIN